MGGEVLVRWRREVSDGLQNLIGGGRDMRMEGRMCRTPGYDDNESDDTDADADADADDYDDYDD